MKNTECRLNNVPSFTEKQAEKTSGNGQAAKTTENKTRIMEYLVKEGKSKAADIADYIGLSSARTRVILAELMDEGKIMTEGNGRARVYLQKN